MSASKPVRIVRAAAVTALGESLEGLWGGLLAGRSGIAPVDRFPVSGYHSGVAACIPGLRAPEGRSLIHGLLDILLPQVLPVPPDTALITATTKGGIDSLERFVRDGSAERDFLIPGLVRELRQRLGLSGEGVNVSAACASSTIAVARAASLVASGRAGSALVVCMDLVSEFVFSGFSALQALSPGPCRPFDRRRNGLSLGEGAAALLLMSPERARREGLAPLGSVLGWGAANDANHVTAPARDACGLIRAVRAALAVAGLEPGDVAAVSAHGTGTVYNDLMELTAFHSLFGRSRPPVYGIKGAIGHTLGAAGGIEVALGLRVLAEGTAPPTVGLVEPAPEADGLVGSCPAPVTGAFLLTTNSGFGGINAATVLSREGS